MPGSLILLSGEGSGQVHLVAQIIEAVTKGQSGLALVGKSRLVRLRLA